MAKTKPQNTRQRVDLLGELVVESAMVSRGWHPIRLDTRRMAANADLLAVNKRRRISIQVKTMTGGTGQARHVFLGYANSYLTSGTPFFNAKESPLIADVVVAVNYRPNNSRLVVLPVALAEKLCREAAKYWYEVRKKDGSKRSAAFPINLNLSGEHKVHADHREALQEVLSKYEDAWKVLSEPIEKLHDPKCWPLSYPPLHPPSRRAWLQVPAIVVRHMAVTVAIVGSEDGDEGIMTQSCLWLAWTYVANCLLYG